MVGNKALYGQNYIKVLLGIYFSEFLNGPDKITYVFNENNRNMGDISGCQAERNQGKRDKMQIDFIILLKMETL